MVLKVVISMEIIEKSRSVGHCRLNQVINMKNISYNNK